MTFKNMQKLEAVWLSIKQNCSTICMGHFTHTSTTPWPNWGLAPSSALLFFKILYLPLALSHINESVMCV